MFSKVKWSDVQYFYWSIIGLRYLFLIQVAYVFIFGYEFVVSSALTLNAYILCFFLLGYSGVHLEDKKLTDKGKKRSLDAVFTGYMVILIMFMFSWTNGRREVVEGYYDYGSYNIALRSTENNLDRISRSFASKFTNVSLLNYQAQSYSQLGEYDKAKEVYARISKEFPEAEGGKFDFIHPSDKIKAIDDALVQISLLEEELKVASTPDEHYHILRDQASSYRYPLNNYREAYAAYLKMRPVATTWTDRIKAEKYIAELKEHVSIIVTQEIEATNKEESLAQLALLEEKLKTTPSPAEQYAILDRIASLHYFSLENYEEAYRTYLHMRPLVQDADDGVQLEGLIRELKQNHRVG